jgi:hypothetical protein
MKILLSAKIRIITNFFTLDREPNWHLAIPTIASVLCVNNGMPPIIYLFVGMGKIFIIKNAKTYTVWKIKEKEDL